MNTIWKGRIAPLLVRWQLRRLLNDPVPINRLFGQAVLLKSGKMDEEDFRTNLERFYREMSPEGCREQVEFHKKKKRLSQPGSYKVDVTALRDDPSADPHRGKLDLWARRFGLLQYMGIRSDVLILRAGEQIPPHGHSGVVSGFYVLEGQVAIRHFDRIQERPGRVMLRKSVDATLGAGQYTTNSECRQNIHWLLGIAASSYLFRFTVTEVPVKRFGLARGDRSRIYVDPTAEPDAEGLICAPYISEAEAKLLQFV